MKYKKQIALALGIVILMASCTGGCTKQDTEEQKTEEEVQVQEEEEKETVPSSVSAEMKKEETVYVKAKADGTVKDIIVSDILRNGTSSDTIRDQSDLREVRNVKGKETFTENGNGELVWQASGNDIYYQGKTDKTLPVELKITCYLEGEEIKPEKLAGKSGNIRIRFDYINHETHTVMAGSEERSISTPFIAVTGLFLDEEKFMNVEMENGKAISDGSRIMAAGIVMPGLSESIALSEVEDMEDLDLPEYLELTAYTTDFELPLTMTAITSDFSDSIDLDDLESYENLKDDIQELQDASKELVDGTQELVDGVVELKDGVVELKDGSVELYDGSVELFEGSVDLDEGAQELKDGAAKLDNGAQDLQDGAVQLKDALKAYNEGLNTLAASMANAGGEGKDIAAAAAELSAGVDQVVSQVLNSIPAQVNAMIGTQFSSWEEVMDSDHPALQEVKGQITQLLTLKESMAQFSAGIAQIYGGVATQLQPASQQILDGSRALCEGAYELKAGTEELYEGTEELKDGTTELYDGVTELVDGTTELKDGVQELDDGVQELYDGSIELRDGMEEFDEDGIQKLYNMVYDDLQKVIDRARAVVDAGEAYQTFTQIAPGMKGSVKFLIETEAIE